MALISPAIDLFCIDCSYSIILQYIFVYKIQVKHNTCTCIMCSEVLIIYNP